MEKFNKLPEEKGWLTRWMRRSSSTSREHVELQPLVYATYQAYLKRLVMMNEGPLLSLNHSIRTPAHLAHSLALSRKNGYALGVKLVRGAYHPYELAAHSNCSIRTMSISPNPDPPVYLSKEDTDACYNQCASTLVSAMAEDIASPKTPPPRLAVLFGTHNWLSTELVLDALVSNGLAREEDRAGDARGALIIPPEVAERCTFAQLYGKYLQPCEFYRCAWVTRTQVWRTRSRAISCNERGAQHPV